MRMRRSRLLSESRMRRFAEGWLVREVEWNKGYDQAVYSIIDELWKQWADRVSKRIKTSKFVVSDYYLIDPELDFNLIYGLIEDVKKDPPGSFTSSEAIEAILDASEQFGSLNIELKEALDIAWNEWERELKKMRKKAKV